MAPSKFLPIRVGAQFLLEIACHSTERKAVEQLADALKAAFALHVPVRIAGTLAALARHSQIGRRDGL